MAHPFIGEIRFWAGLYPPVGWNFCDGTSFPISENETLFTLIGTTYGGDGETYFQVPDLRGRVPVHVGGGVMLGETGGSESVTLTVGQLPTHNHALVASVDPATTSKVAGNVPASMPAAGTGSAYGTVEPFRPLDPSSVALVGGNQPHDNMQPYLVTNYIISMFGIFPSQG